MLKFAEHLWSFQTTWAHTANSCATLMSTCEERAIVHKILQDADQHQAVKPVPQFQMQTVTAPESARLNPQPQVVQLYPIFNQLINTEFCFKHNNSILQTFIHFLLKRFKQFP